MRKSPDSWCLTERPCQVTSEPPRITSERWLMIKNCIWRQVIAHQHEALARYLKGGLRQITTVWRPNLSPEIRNRNLLNKKDVTHSNVTYWFNSCTMLWNSATLYHSVHPSVSEIKLNTFPGLDRPSSSDNRHGPYAQRRPELPRPQNVAFSILLQTRTTDEAQTGNNAKSEQLVRMSLLQYSKTWTLRSEAVNNRLLFRTT